MQLHHFRGMHSFEPVCSVVPMNTEMHTYAFNALMANNYVLIHLHFLFSWFDSSSFSSFSVFSFFFYIFCSFRSSFVCNEAMGEQTYVRNECVLTLGAFDVLLMHTTNIKENGLTRDLCVVCASWLLLLFFSFFLSFRCLVLYFLFETWNVCADRTKKKMLLFFLCREEAYA